MLLHGKLQGNRVSCFTPFFPVVVAMTSGILSLCRVSPYQTAALPLVQGATVDTLLVKYTLFSALCEMILTNRIS